MIDSNVDNDLKSSFTSESDGSLLFPIDIPDSAPNPASNSGRDSDPTSAVVDDDDDDDDVDGDNNNDGDAAATANDDDDSDAKGPYRSSPQIL